MKLLIFLMVAVCAITIPAASKPNILLIITDDQGWGDLSIHGNSNIKTPHIDSIGHTGTMFNNFYVSSVCSPTRASLLTGRYFPRTGVKGTSKGEERIDLDETLLTEILKKNGYVTGGFGKWHSGLQYPYHPNARGFDEWYGFCCGHWSNYFDAPVQHNGVEMTSKGFLPDDLTNRAMDFMEKNREKPFFCYVPYNTPHGPMQVPDEFYDKVKNRKITQFATDRSKEEMDFTIAALAMCENIDWNVGRLLKKLDELKIADNTIVIYMSDNGPNSHRWNGGLKGKKGSIDEGGVKSPFLIKWLGKIKHQSVDTIAAHIDILPTLCEMAGIKPEISKDLDGVSLAGLLTDGAKIKERELFSFRRNGIQIRSQKYRASLKGIYDMEKDPGQTKNLKNEIPNVFKEMVAKLKSMEAEMARESSAARPITAGHPDEKMTKLPIRECLFNGEKIRRSAKSPNDTHMVDWTETEEYPYWEISLLSSGEYEILIDYTCAIENLGCEVMFEFNGKKLSKVIDEAFDPKLILSPDRIKRTQSYDKPFKRVSLGRVELKSGEGILKLTCTRKRGSGIIDLKNIFLRKLPASPQ